MHDDDVRQLIRDITATIQEIELTHAQQTRQALDATRNIQRAREEQDRLRSDVNRLRALVDLPEQQPPPATLPDLRQGGRQGDTPLTTDHTPRPLQVGDRVYIRNQIRRPILWNAPGTQQRGPFSYERERCAIVERITANRVYITTTQGTNTWRSHENLRLLHRCAYAEFYDEYYRNQSQARNSSDDSSANDGVPDYDEDYYSRS